MTRSPAVAGMFYPADQPTLSAMVDQLWPMDQTPEQALAVMVPHAGYVYSGATAAATIARVKVPDTVVVLGPNHRGMGRPAAVMARGEWQTPMGEIAIDSEFAALLLEKSSLLESDRKAHEQEHSLEVQLPFLHKANPNFKLVPVCLARSDLDGCREIGSAMARAIIDYGRPVLMVASTDMTHYETADSARIKDEKALEKVLKLDPKGLYQTVAREGITMCGVIPTAIVLFAANELGARRAELVEYTNSGAASGDYNQVVGYAGVIIS